jgi:hypothetical protein
MSLPAAKNLEITDVEGHAGEVPREQHENSKTRDCSAERDIDLLFTGCWTQISGDTQKGPSTTIPSNHIAPQNLPQEALNLNLNIDASDYSLQRWLEQTYSDPFISIGESCFANRASCAENATTLHLGSFGVKEATAEKEEK